VQSASTDEKKDKKPKKDKAAKKPLSLSIPDSNRPSTSFLTSVGGGNTHDTFGGMGFISSLKKDSLTGQLPSPATRSPLASPQASSSKSRASMAAGSDGERASLDDDATSSGGGPVRSLRDLKKRSSSKGQSEAAAAKFSDISGG
jgi:hypothetical protein